VGRLAAILTLLSFLSTLGIGAFERMFFLRVWGFAIGLIFPLTAIATILQFDLIKRKGDIVFKELSDELQWHVRYGREEMASGSEPNSEFRPELRARIVLREYAYSTTLPLVSSTNGPLVYAAVNASFAFISVMLSILIRI
jgi:hypothetical protein